MAARAAHSAATASSAGSTPSWTASGRLHLSSTEPDAPAEAGPAIAAALRRLAGFIQAREIVTMI